MHILLFRFDRKVFALLPTATAAASAEKATDARTKIATAHYLRLRTFLLAAAVTRRLFGAPPAFAAAVLLLAAAALFLATATAVLVAKRTTLVIVIEFVHNFILRIVSAYASSRASVPYLPSNGKKTHKKCGKTFDKYLQNIYNNSNYY